MGEGSNDGAAMRCRCGATYTLKQWADLELVGIQDDGEGTMIEMRNCVCGTTRARDVDFRGAIRLLNDTAKRLRHTLGRLRDIDRVTSGLAAEIVEIDRGAVHADTDVEGERARALRIVRETLESVSPANGIYDRVAIQKWVTTLGEILEARIAG